MEPTKLGGGTELSNAATSFSTRLSAAARSLNARSWLRWRSQVQEGSSPLILLFAWNVGGLSLDDSLSSEPDLSELWGNLENIFCQLFGFL